MPRLDTASVPPLGASDLADRRARAVLWAEFAFLYGAVPVALATLLPASAMWPAMFGCLGLAFLLLRRAEGFRWRDAVALPSRNGWLLGIAAGGLSLLASIATMLALRPESLFGLPLHMPHVWLTVMCLYPFASALPQEILFRTLFFTRYRHLFASERIALAVNGAVFGLAHLLLWNWVAVASTVAAGWLFGLIYLRAGPKRGLLTVTLVHGLAGCAMFTAGMGVFFYHGMAGR